MTKHPNQRIWKSFLPVGRCVWWNPLHHLMWMFYKVSCQEPPGWIRRDGKCFIVWMDGVGAISLNLLFEVIIFRKILLMDNIGSNKWGYKDICIHTPPKIHMSPKNRPSQRETSLPTIHFQQGPVAVCSCRKPGWNNWPVCLGSWPPPKKTDSPKLGLDKWDTNMVAMATNFFLIFHPDSWQNEPIWRAYFTNDLCIYIYIYMTFLCLIT